MAAKRKTNLSQGSWSPGSDTEDLLDIMSRVSQALLSHRDTDLEPESLGKLSASISSAIYARYMSEMDSADMDEDAEDCFWELFLSTIHGTIVYADVDEFQKKTSIATLSKICFDQAVGLWEGFSRMDQGEESDEDDDDEDEDEDEDEEDGY